MYVEVVLSKKINLLLFVQYESEHVMYKGPVWVPHGLKFLYGTHMGPIWASCPDSAQMGPICPCVLGKPLGNFVKNGYSESETGMSNIMFSMYFQ